MSSIYVTGKASSPKTEYWQGEINYSTWFNNDGTSTVRFSSIRIKKGSKTTDASYPGSAKFYLVVNGTSHNIGALGISVPTGARWSDYGTFTLDFNVSAGSSLSVGLDDPWNGLYDYNNNTATAWSAALPTYSISYNANGGTGTVTADTKTWGTPLFLKNGGYTRTGYNLLGWSTNSSASSPTYWTGEDAQARKYTTEADAIMYAIWEAANPQFSVSVSAEETVINYAQFTLVPASNVSCTVKDANNVVVATKSLGTNVTSVAAGSITSSNWASGKSIQANQTYTITFTAANSTSTSLTTTHSYSITTYDYPKITESFQTTEIAAGSARTLTIYNPLGRSYTIQAKIGGSTIGTVTDSGHTKGNTLSKSITLGIDAACSAIANTAVSGTVQYSVITSEPSTHTYSLTAWQDTVTLSADNAAPTIDATKIDGFISCLDSVDDVVDVSGSSSKLFKDKSKLKVKLISSSNPFTPKGTSLNSNYTISFNNKSITTAVVGTDYYELSNSISSSSANAVVINSTSYTVTVTATDGRGFPATIEKQLTIYTYTTPTVAISKVYRDDGYGSNVTLEPSITWCANMTNIANNTVTLYYKKVSDSSYSSVAKTISNGKITISNISSDFAYQFYIIATDELDGVGTSPVVSLSVGTPPVFIDVEKHAIGIDCLPDAKGLFVNGVERHPGAIVGQSSDTATNYWYKIATLTNTSSQTDLDYNISMKVSQGYDDNNTRLGMLTAHIRTSDTTAPKGIVSNAQLTWEYALSGINPNHFVLAYKNNTTNGGFQAELWTYQDTSKGQYHFDVLTSGERTQRYCDKWQFADNVAASGSSAITSGYTQVISTIGALYGYNKIYSGATSPDASLGAVGDLYVLI